MVDNCKSREDKNVHHGGSPSYPGAYPKFELCYLGINEYHPIFYSLPGTSGWWMHQPRRAMWLEKSAAVCRTDDRWATFISDTCRLSTTTRANRVVQGYRIQAIDKTLLILTQPSNTTRRRPSTVIYTRTNVTLACTIDGNEFQIEFETRRNGTVLELAEQISVVWIRRCFRFRSMKISVTSLSAN